MKLRSGFSNHYQILGVPRNATIRDIKRAHRRLAKKYHPDGKGETRSEEFVRIREAYEVLSNPKRRLKYDRYGDSDCNEDLMERLQILHGPLGHPFFRFSLKFHYKRMVDIGCPECPEMETCAAWREQMQVINCPKAKSGDLNAQTDLKERRKR